MFGKQRRRADATVSIEVAARALNVVRVRADASPPVIEISERRILPPARDVARPSALAAELAELAPTLRVGDPEIRLIVESPALLLRSLPLPRMPHSEVLSTIRLQWPQLTQSPFDEMQLDVFCTRSRNPRSPGMTALVVALPREELHAIVSPLREAGLEPDAVIPAAVAINMLRTAEVDRQKTNAAAEVLLDIGSTRSCLVLCRGEEVHAAREIPTGGDSFTQILARELDLPVAEAEKLKRKHGVLENPESDGAGEDASTLRSIHGALRPVAERLAAEVQRSIAFMQEERAEQRPARLLLTGGGARLPGLAGMMAELLDMAVETWDPGQRLPVPTDGREAAGEPGAGAVSGARGGDAGAMCLGGALGRPPVNLLKPARTEGRARRFRPGPALYAGAYLLLLAGTVGWFWNEERRIGDEVAAQERRIAMIPASDRSALSLGPHVHARGRELVDFSRLFEELAWLVPEEVSLEAMTLARPATRPGGTPRLPRVVEIEGVARGPVIASERTLANLLEAIEDSPIIDNVQLVRSATVREREEPGLRFAFTCEIDESGMAGARLAAVPAGPGEVR